MKPILQFIQEGYKVFSGYQRPEQCIDHQGDPEYREYEESLAGISCSSLDMVHIGHISWGPLLAIGPEAMAHFMPRLIEFAVNGLNDKSDQLFAVLFTEVVGKGPDSDQFLLFGHEQRQFVLRAFMLIKGLYYPIFKSQCYESELNQAIEQWQI